MKMKTFIKRTQEKYPFLNIEYFHLGEKIDKPEYYFDKNNEIFEFGFPSIEEIERNIEFYLPQSDTYKLVISEYGFHRVPKYNSE
jgi:hypothetical protein